MIESEGSTVHLELEANEKQIRDYYISDETMKLTVAKGDTVEVKQII